MGSRYAYKRRILCAAISVVVLCLIAPVSVPLSFTPVPLSLATIAVCVCSACLGSTASCAAIGVYLLLGIFGLPVFAGGYGGWAAFSGASCGYLLGYLPCAAVIGRIIRRERRFKFHLYPLAMAVGLVLCYLPGLIGLSIARDTGLVETMRQGFNPFCLFELVKIAVATVIAYPLGTKLRYYLQFS